MIILRSENGIWNDSVEVDEEKEKKRGDNIVG